MAEKKKGLGTGLGILFGEEDYGDPNELKMLSVSRLEPRQTQPRSVFDDEALQELADSIRRYGVIQPVTARKLPSGYYQIIAGERRWRAARLAGLSEVPAIVIEADDRKATELALIENLQREDLDPMEEAEGYKKLIDNYQMTQEDVAERVGKSRSAVANALRLLGLCPEVRALVEDGKLSGGHARALLTLNPTMQKKAAQMVIDGALNVRQTEALVKKLGAKPRDKKNVDADEINYAKLAASELTDKLGRGCRIVAGRKKGRIELDYYGMDDLNDLLEALALIKKRKGKA